MRCPSDLLMRLGDNAAWLLTGREKVTLCALQATNDRMDAIEFFQRSPDAVKSLTALVRCSHAQLVGAGSLIGLICNAMRGAAVFAPVTLSFGGRAAHVSSGVMSRLPKLAQ